MLNLQWFFIANYDLEQITIFSIFNNLHSMQKIKGIIKVIAKDAFWLKVLKPFLYCSSNYFQMNLNLKIMNSCYELIFKIYNFLKFNNKYYLNIY